MVKEKLDEVESTVRSRWVVERYKKDQNRFSDQYRSALEQEKARNRQLVAQIAQQQDDLTQLKALLQLVLWRCKMS